MARHETPPAIPAEGEIPLPSKIRAKRWSLGLSQTEFADRIGGYDRSYVAHLERGALALTVELLGKIAAALGLSSDEELVNAPKEQIMEWIKQGEERTRERRARKRRHKPVAQPTSQGMVIQPDSSATAAVRRHPGAFAAPLIRRRSAGTAEESMSTAALPLMRRSVGAAVDSAVADEQLSAEEEDRLAEVIVPHVISLSRLLKSRRGDKP